MNVPPFVNYPRNGQGLMMNGEEASDAIRKLNRVSVAWVALHVVNAIVAWASSSLMNNREYNLEGTFLIYFVLLSSVGCLVLQGIWGNKTAHVVSHLLGERTLFPPLVIGIGCGLPVLGYVGIVYMFDYALCALNLPRIPIFKWYSAYSKGGWLVNTTYLFVIILTLLRAYSWYQSKLSWPGPVMMIIEIFVVLFGYFSMRASTKKMSEFLAQVP